MRVIFVCTGNSCRSQMAEGLLRHLAGDRFEVASAGIHPIGVSPLAVEAMDEIGIDISRHTSDPVSKYLGETFDYVVTVCDYAKGLCPTFPGKHHTIAWSVRDPFSVSGTDEKRKAVFRKVRDDLKKRIEAFLRDTVGQKAAP